MVNLICIGPILVLKHILGVVHLQEDLDHVNDSIDTAGEQHRIIITAHSW